MPAVDLVIEWTPSASIRARQASSMFDVPLEACARLEWHGSVPIESRPWNVGLIVGPSGSGKSTLARQLFGPMPELTWGTGCVLDDVQGDHKLDDITRAFGSVGFNTIPAWLRRYEVLSTGEKFRVDIARRLLELPGTIMVDEFTSVVDRQVAKIGSHAIQKHVRRMNRQFVAVGCHYDVIDWLQPDWVLEPATMSFTWREVQRRPAVSLEIKRTPLTTWGLFAPYHYMSRDLTSSGTKCYAAHVDGRPVAFISIRNRPNPKVGDVYGISRVVTLPDWQGLGLVHVLIDTLGAAHKAVGHRLHAYPAHPSLVRSVDKSPNWSMVQRPGRMRSSIPGSAKYVGASRPNAVLAYVGPAMDIETARRLLG